MTDTTLPPETEAELHALHVIAEAYAKLDQPARERVTHYLFDRFVSSAPVEHDHVWALRVVAEMWLARGQEPGGLTAAAYAELTDELDDLRDDTAPSRAEYREACAVLRAGLDDATGTPDA